MNGDVIALLLIRHAKADERGPEYPDDSQRPLTKKGRAQARKLAGLFKALDVRFDYLFSSPYTRALQTAEPLGARLKKGRVETLQSLTDDQYPKLLADIATKMEENAIKEDKRAGKAESTIVALVGHEPYLGEFASTLLTADPERVHIDFKKAGVLTLRGRLEPGRMTLLWMLEPSLYSRPK